MYFVIIHLYAVLLSEIFEKSKKYRFLTKEIIGKMEY